MTIVTQPQPHGPRPKYGVTMTETVGLSMTTAALADLDRKRGRMPRAEFIRLAIDAMPGVEQNR